jgi:hypothetical protein
MVWLVLISQPIIWLWYGSGGQLQASQLEDSGLILGQSKWDFWWMKWHWDKCFSTYISFLLLVSFHQCFMLIHASFINNIFFFFYWHYNPL